LLRCIKTYLFLWREFSVKEYNQRHLAYRSNSAAAFFAGIAKLFEKLTGDQSVAGLLRDDLLYHLLWKPVSPWKKLERGLKDVPSCCGYRLNSGMIVNTYSATRTVGNKGYSFCHRIPFQPFWEAFAKPSQTIWYPMPLLSPAASWQNVGTQQIC
jgi:hypothetical protein